jgi:hypothetical protein
MKTQFENVDDLKAVIEAVRSFGEDLLFAWPFELLYEENLRQDVEEKLIELAKTIAPDLNDQISVENELGDELQDRVLSLVSETRTAYWKLGILVGAMLANPQGQAFEKFAAGWMRATLAMPRHADLRQGKTATES